MITAKSPQGSLDMLQASANNFYSGLSMADLKGFHDTHPLNSRGQTERQDRGRGLPRRNSGRQDPAGPLRRVPAESQRVPAEGVDSWDAGGGGRGVQFNQGLK